MSDHLRKGCENDTGISFAERHVLGARHIARFVPPPGSVFRSFARARLQ